MLFSHSAVGGRQASVKHLPASVPRAPRPRPPRLLRRARFAAPQHAGRRPILGPRLTVHTIPPPHLNIARRRAHSCARLRKNEQLPVSSSKVCELDTRACSTLLTKGFVAAFLAVSQRSIMIIMSKGDATRGAASDIQRPRIRTNYN